MITIENRIYTYEINPDTHMGPPWKENDGHGIVSDWVHRAPDDGELTLAYDRGAYRLYDFDSTMEKAKREGWGVKDSEGLTPDQITHRAVMEDYKHLRAWCMGDWEWVYVVVTAPDGKTTSLGGIESSDREYLKDTAEELAEELHAEWAVEASAVV